MKVTSILINSTEIDFKKFKFYSEVAKIHINGSQFRQNLNLNSSRLRSFYKLKHKSIETLRKPNIFVRNNLAAVGRCQF